MKTIAGAMRAAIYGAAGTLGGLAAVVFLGAFAVAAVRRDMTRAVHEMMAGLRPMPPAPDDGDHGTTQRRAEMPSPTNGGAHGE